MQLPLNRIYHVQSRERQPVRIAMPGTAGGVASHAMIPGLRTLSKIEETKATEEIDKWGDRAKAVKALGRGVNDALGIYARAKVRRDKAEDDKLDAAYLNYMHDNAYGTIDENGNKTAGTLEASLTTKEGGGFDGAATQTARMEKDFDETDAYLNASEGARLRFAERRGRLGRSIIGKSIDLQTRQQAAYWASGFREKLSAYDKQLQSESTPADNESWTENLREQLPDRIVGEALKQKLGELDAQTGEFVPYNRDTWQTTCTLLEAGVVDEANMNRLGIMLDQAVAYPNSQSSAIAFDMAEKMVGEKGVFTNSMSRGKAGEAVDKAKRARDLAREAEYKNIEDQAGNILSDIFLGKDDGTGRQHITTLIASLPEDRGTAIASKLAQVDFNNRVSAYAKRLMDATGDGDAIRRIMAELEGDAELKGKVQTSVFGTMPGKKFTANNVSAFLDSGKSAKEMTDIVNAKFAEGMMEPTEFIAAKKRIEDAADYRKVCKNDPAVIAENERMISDALAKSGFGWSDGLYETDDYGSPKVDANGDYIILPGKEDDVVRSSEFLEGGGRRETGWASRHIGRASDRIDLTVETHALARRVAHDYIVGRVTGRIKGGSVVTAQEISDYLNAQIGTKIQAANDEQFRHELYRFATENLGVSSDPLYKLSTY